MSHVIVRLMGGLGNQLFQYATGYALSKRIGVPLLLDRSFLDARPSGMDWTPRELELDHFSVPLQFASPEEVRRARRILDKPLHRVLHKVIPGLYKWDVLVEPSMRYTPRINGVEAPVYLQGHWQSERYFLEVADELRKDLFVPRLAPDGMNAELSARIKEECTASIHVRRGDYLTAIGKGHHHSCDAAYYSKAAACLVEEHDVKHFLIFSDDPDQVRNELALPYPHTFVGHNTGSSAYWDLFLMEQCAHHIIANSSFSWWGAWLDPSPSKVVIAPDRWFSDPDIPTDDLLPKQWLKR